MATGIEHAVIKGPTASEYIAHHLTFFNNVGKRQTSLFDISILNYDTLFYSVALGLLVIFVLWIGTRKATSGAPSRFQCAIEMLVEMVESNAKTIISQHGEKSRHYVAPMALTVFLWVFMMNAMDFLPLDLLPKIWSGIYGMLGHDPHHAYMRVVPTADLSGTMGLSMGVLVVCLYYNIKIKGLGGWAHELVTAPFGTSKNPLLALPLAICNFAMQCIEFGAKTLSHGMRLFGNMFAGELIFMLIALLGATWTGFTVGSVSLWMVQLVAGFAWAVFHILVVALQAFIFMMLALVYISQSHAAH